MDKYHNLKRGYKSSLVRIIRKYLNNYGHNYPRNFDILSLFELEIFTIERVKRF